MSRRGSRASASQTATAAAGAVLSARGALARYVNLAGANTREPQHVVSPTSQNGRRAAVSDGYLDGAPAWSNSIAVSADSIAAGRVDPWDAARNGILGNKVFEVNRKFLLQTRIEFMSKWMGPL
jgi:hypothetical protein